jgi:hypothetical protein
MEQVGNIIIDFNVTSSRPSDLIVADTSEWIYAENLPAFIIIQMPGSTKKKTFPFKKHAWNRFNSHVLGLSCLKNDCKDEVYINLPDGIYTICLKSGYEDIENTKFYLKTDLFKQEFAKTMIKYGLDYKEGDKEFLCDMVQIKGTLEVAESHAYNGDFVKAQRFFEKAKSMLKRKSDCTNCV